MMEWGQFFFQNANSSIMEEMIMFHDHAMIILVIIIMLIMYLLFFMLFNKFINRFLLEGQFIEIFWTIIPMLMLFFLVIPSLSILYLSDELINPELTIKIIGHQWYWSYEYSDFGEVNFDSFMISDNFSEVNKNNEFNLINNYGLIRLLDVDNRMILPLFYHIRMLVSSFDVIHSFTIPVLGIKVDAVPGRINQIGVLINRGGLFYGQCSEICGVNHSFMPIVLESVEVKSFLNWLFSY
uniref:cytochrome c oxidase subunit II n=1 Tax=Anastatus shichengensis TaxID=3025492 RepID=UPI0023AADF43|nr:cytochrome c oxidase subunit II [Anastatus shichengensis]WCO11514.1 cytochrome c oxidase subunit 2 [Anastatus shichengensis]